LYKVIITLCIGFWFSVSVFGQIRKIQFNHITGLSSNSVTAVLKDSYGFMWFGTVGIDRFDGYEIINYRYQHNDSSSIKGNQVYKILEDKTKNLWICTDAGVNRYNRVYDNFTYFKFISDKDGIVLTRDICMDHSGNLWLGTTDGLYKYDYDKELFSKVQIKNSINIGDIYSLTEDHIGNIWLGNEKREIFIFNRVENIINKFLVGHFKESYNGKRNTINQIYEDRLNNIWILTNQTGVYKFAKNNQLVHFEKDVFLTGKSIMNNSAYSIAELESGEILIGAGGINIFDPLKQTWNYIQNDPNDIGSIQSNITPKIYVDELDFIWIASGDGGVDLSIPIKKSIEHYNHVPFNKNSLIHNNIRDFYEDDEGIIWIGTDKGGLDRFDPEKKLFKNFAANLSIPDMLASPAVLCIERAPGNKIWVGTYEGGLHLFNPINGKFKRYNYDIKNPNSIAGEHVWDMQLDPETKNLWLGILWGSNGGLDEYITTKDIFVHHSSARSKECSQKHFSVTKILCDSKRNVWIGSYEFGLDKYNIEQNCFKTFLFNINNPFSINSNHIKDIFEDSKKRLWIGTDNGINLFNYEKEYFLQFGNKDGMEGKEVRSILEDNEGNLWVATDKGISKFTLPALVSDITNDNSYKSKLPKDFVYFKNYDGVADFNKNEFRRAALKSSNGKLYFGGLNGFNIIDPSKMKDNPHRPPVIITEFRLFNEKVKIARKGLKNESPLKNDISVTKEIVLHSHQNVFSFKFAALNYSSTSKNQYAYRMEGFEKNWNYVGNQRTASYTNLPPGKYKFHVKASNEDLIWNEKGASINLIILPPWWKTIWFRIIFGFFVIIMFYLWYIKKLSDLEKQKIKLERLVSERTASLKEANKQLKDRQEEILVQKDELEMQNTEINAQRFFLEEKTKILLSQNHIITEQNDKIKHYSEKIHESDMQKINFLTNISHEFRTPLSLIIDPAERLMNEIEDGKHKSLIRLIKTNTNRLLRLVNQILDIVKLDTGKYKLQLSESDLLVTIRNIIDSFEYRASLQEIEISCKSFSGHIYVSFCVDAFEKIMYNLLSNSIKYSGEKSKISVEINKRTKSSIINPEIFGNREILELEIIFQDTGVGIPEEFLDKIFDRFYQVESKADNLQGGSGIGLSVVKEMVELHGGKIIVNSSVGKGTTFIIIFPVGILSNNEIESIKSSKSNIEFHNFEWGQSLIMQEEFKEPKFSKVIQSTNNKPSILVVEDDLELNRYLAGILNMDYYVYSAQNGTDGLQIAKNDIPDLIICDVMMPKMSGVEFCQMLKSDLLTNHIPIILLTAKSSVLNMLEGYATGADDYLTKPFDSKILIAKVNAIINSRKQLQEKYKGEISNILNSLVRKDKQNPFLQKATEIVEKNIVENDFDGEMLAQEMAMSLRQLYRKMEALTNQTVNEFIRNIQLKKGAELLLEGECNISEVCYLTGMSNPRYFSTLFKKQYGMTPSEFIKMKDNINR